MSASHCHIQFENNPLGVYFPGQTLTGSAALSLSEVLKVKAISLQIKGCAAVQWSESSGTGKNRRTTYYRGRQDYINTVTYLVGSDEGIAQDIAPGTHTYRFSCALPHHLPTSYEGNHGYIRYTIKIVLHRPWKTDPTYKVAFSVIRNLNLNDLGPTLRLPNKLEITKVFCCGPCSSDPLYISAQVPITGYVPGQTIAIKIEAHNRSKKRVTEFSSKLIRTVTYISQTPYTKLKLVPEIVAEVRCPGVGASDKGNIEQHLRIPAVSPTSDFCQVLTVSYELEVEAKISGPSINPRIRIPITIGTFPLAYSAIPMVEHQVQVSIQPTELPPTDTPGHLPAALPQPVRTATGPTDLPPPSYEEAVGSAPANIRDEDENELGSNSYVPQYMVYNFEAPTNQPSQC